MRWYHVTLGLALLGGLFSVAVDWDHIFAWVLHTAPPFIAVGTITSAGRPFHTWYIFLLYSVVLSAWFATSGLGHIQSYIMDRRLTT